MSVLTCVVSPVWGWTWVAPDRPAPTPRCQHPRRPDDAPEHCGNLAETLASASRRRTVDAMEPDTAGVCDRSRQPTGSVALDGAPIRVLIVDDSVVIRRLLSTIVAEDPELEVAGVAANG